MTGALNGLTKTYRSVELDCLKQIYLCIGFNFRNECIYIAVSFTPLSASYRAGKLFKQKWLEQILENFNLH